MQYFLVSSATLAHIIAARNWTEYHFGYAGKRALTQDVIRVSKEPLLFCRVSNWQIKAPQIDTNSAECDNSNGAITARGVNNPSVKDLCLYALTEKIRKALKESVVCFWLFGASFCGLVFTTFIRPFLIFSPEIWTSAISK